MNETQPDGYLALPPAGAGNGVLVLHAWWGLNQNIRDLCDRLAAEGFVAFAPDLYGGQVATTIAGAEQLSSALFQQFPKGRELATQAAAFLRQRSGQPERGLALIGFSMGAAYALDLANAAPEHARAVVLFYGTGDNDFSNSRAAYQGHFAEEDPYEPREAIDATEQALRAAGRPVEFFRYPGVGHWFFEPGAPVGYDAAAAELAWQRTLQFLKNQAGS